MQTLQIGKFTLKVKSATFRYITDCWSGPGWDFKFYCEARDEDEAGRSLFSFGVTFYSEAAPIPLDSKEADLTGVEVFLPLSYDEASGEPLFGLVVVEEHEVSQVRLKFVQKEGLRYLISIEGVVARTVLGYEAPLKLLAWTERTADHSYGA